MGNWRLVWNCLCLTLPTAIVVALALWLYVDQIPEIEKAERDRVREIYRETALDLQKSHVNLRAGSGLPEGWKPTGKMKPGRWGFLPDASRGATIVWYQEGNEVYSREAEFVPETDYRLLFAAYGSFFLLVLVGVTIVGIRYFVRYVKSRDDFLAAAAHDLTTPLVGMRMMVGRDDDEARQLVERMLLLVANIKDFLKLGGRRRRPEAKAVDIVALAKEAYQLFAADYEVSEGGAVVFDSSRVQSNAVEVLADATLALQILWNLFGNDLKYAAPYGKVMVRFFREGRFVRIAFIDEGQGMTPRQMRRAFDRYYRARTALQTGKGGFGIGLCTAREFARAMGGELTVSANKPQGCVFTLSLPASPSGPT